MDVRHRIKRRNRFDDRANTCSCILVAIYTDEDHVYCFLLLNFDKFLLAHTLQHLKASQLLEVAPTKRTPAKKLKTPPRKMLVRTAM